MWRRRVAVCDVGYELGLAVGKLRRLKDLILHLSEDGRFYHAVAQGLAASGGERPNPLLWRLMLPGTIWSHAHEVASLLLPSVQSFVTPLIRNSRGALLMAACALRQAGYKHVWALRAYPRPKADVGAIVKCKLVDVDVREHIPTERPPLVYGQKTCYL
jgi:hypothetical protein